MSRSPRPWTAQDQAVAEVAAACGVSYSAIGKAIGRHGETVRYRLLAAVAKETRERIRKWKAANPEKVREKAQQRYAANPQKTKDQCRRWRAANPERIRELGRKYRAANVVVARERCREWYASNPNKARAKNRNWRHANPEKVADMHRRRTSLKRCAQRNSLTPLTLDQVKQRFALWRNRCAFCGVDAKHPRNGGRKRLAVEHVLAISRRGLDEANNIMPACLKCNSSKNDSPIEAWYRKQPSFTEARWRKICRHCPAAVIGQLPLALPPGDEEAA